MKNSIPLSSVKVVGLNFLCENYNIVFFTLTISADIENLIAYFDKVGNILLVQTKLSFDWNYFQSSMQSAR